MSPVRCLCLFCQLTATPAQINWALDSEEGFNPDNTRPKARPRPCQSQGEEMGLSESLQHSPLLRSAIACSLSGRVREITVSNENQTPSRCSCNWTMFISWGLL